LLSIYFNLMFIGCHSLVKRSSILMITLLLGVWRFGMMLKVSKVNYYLMFKRRFLCMYYSRSWPLSRDFVSTFWPLFWGVGLMAGAISVSRNPVIRRKHFSVLATVYSSLDPDANRHQLSFWFKLMQSWSENKSETSWW